MIKFLKIFTVYQKGLNGIIDFRHFIIILGVIAHIGKIK